MMDGMGTTLFDDVWCNFVYGIEIHQKKSIGF